MPKALERALKRKVASKGWSEERKDAYVYGTLRKTGWKPSHQKNKKMSDPDDRIVRLSAINQRLDELIQFQDDDDRNRFPKKTAAGAGLAGAGVAGLYAAGARAQGLGLRQTGEKFAQNVRSIGRGGLGDFGTTIKTGYGVVAPKVTSAAKTAYGAAAPVVKSGYSAAKSGIGNLLKRFRFNAVDRTIEFAGNPQDPGAGQFGGTDPGILNQTYEDAEKVSALQRLKLKIAKLRGMGLYNY